MNSIYRDALILMTLFSMSPVQGMEQINCDSMLEKWSREELYFVPAEPMAVNWTGSFFEFKSRTCFRSLSSETKDGPACLIEKMPCPKGLRDRAEKKYPSEPDFDRYRESLGKCLSPVHEACLKGLVSRTAQFTFGAEPYSDRRESFLKSIGSKGVHELKRLIEPTSKGVRSNYTAGKIELSFENENSYRAGFQLRGGGWQLIYFLSGD